MSRLGLSFGILHLTAALAIRIYAQDSLTNGLVAFYPFNGNANDESGHDNYGVVYGASLIADRFGAANSAYTFDGSSDYVRIAYSPMLDITGDLTISAWIRTTTTSAPIVFSDMQETSPHNGYSLRLRDNGALNVICGDRILLGNAPVNLDLWTHVAFTLSGTIGTLYVNGTSDAAGTVGVPTASGLDPTIGASSTSSPHYFFNGAIDDVRVYNRALSPAELEALYAIPEPSTLALLSAGALSVLVHVRRARKKGSPTD